MTALTLEATIEVGAGPIATHGHCLQTLININTFLASRVKAETPGTGAPEGAVSVDTGASLTDVLHHFTFIEVFRSTSRAPSPWTQWTQFSELRCVDIGTLTTATIALLC